MDDDLDEVRPILEAASEDDGAAAVIEDVVSAVSSEAFLAAALADELPD